MKNKWKCEWRQCKSKYARSACTQKLTRQEDGRFRAPRNVAVAIRSNGADICVRRACNDAALSRRRNAAPSRARWSEAEASTLSRGRLNTPRHSRDCKPVRKPEAGELDCGVIDAELQVQLAVFALHASRVVIVAACEIARCTLRRASVHSAEQIGSSSPWHPNR